MNKNIIKIYVVLSVVLFFSCSQKLYSQKLYLKKANKEYNAKNFYNASIYYNQALKKGNTLTDENNLKIANTFYYLKDYQKALTFFKKTDLSKRDFESQLNYSKILQFNKDFNKAKQAYTNLENISSKLYNDTTIDKFVESCQLSIDKKMPEYIQYKIKESNINVKGESFGVCFYNNGILYSAPTKQNVTNYIVDTPSSVDRYGNNFKNVFYSNLLKNGEIGDTSYLMRFSDNKNHHIGSVSFLPDSNRFYFSKTIKFKNKPIIKIFSIDKIGNEYKNLKELNFNSNSYSCAQPSISEDGKSLYFTSDMPGGYGETDIYVSHFENGDWAKPINLGPGINTEATEMFPFIKNNGVLYFSSNGKVGFGGLDIYYALNINGKWTHVVHKDRPLNSSADDFAYVENPKNEKEIFFSSNRDSKPGIDKIYFAKKLDLPPDTIRGRIIDNLTDKPVAGARLCLLKDSLNGDTLAKAYTDENGNYSLIVPKKQEEDNEQHLFTVIKKDGYEDKVVDFEGRYSDTDRPPLKNSDIALKAKIKKEQVIVFHNIHFDYGKADLKDSSISVLDKLIDVMNKNERMVIELSAHTDSRSSKRFNQKLSDKRAESAKAYLVSKGIAPERIVAKGYGETRLLNGCKDGVPCTEAEHAVNRRIEVKVLSN